MVSRAIVSMVNKGNFAPENWAWTVWDRVEPSTKLSTGSSVVNTVSKFDTSYPTASIRTISTKNNREDAYHRTGHASFEWGLYLLRQKFLKVDMFPKERMFLDFFCAVNSKTTGWITGQEPSEDALRLETNFWSEDERIIQDLLVHLVCHFY